MSELAEGAAPEDLRLLDRLRRGDEAAFASLVDRHHNSLLRLAMAHVSDRSIAEEVVQETWIGVLEGLARFEGRSSLKTWIFRILTNKAKTRGVRESQHVSFSPLDGADDGSNEPAVDAMRFQQTGYWVDHWAALPGQWEEETPEKLLLSKESGIYMEKAIDTLPPSQKQVLVMRDVEGMSSEEVCNILGLSETNQRVLLHRARAKVRRALERYLAGDVAQP